MHRLKFHSEVPKDHYRDKTFGLEKKKCKCGCGCETKWLQREYRYNDWINGHNKSRLGKRNNEAQLKAARIRALSGALTFLGRRHSEKTKRMLSDKNKGRCAGDKNPMWKGGIFKSKYPKDFNKDLKNVILGRDFGSCQMCKKTNSVIAVHHIDYDKRNNSIWNLISLCRKCHGRTNHNRSYWHMVCKDLMYFRKKEFTIWCHKFKE